MPCCAQRLKTICHGESARNSVAHNAAVRPQARRMNAQLSATAATPAHAAGRRADHSLSPNAAHKRHRRVLIDGRCGDAEHVDEQRQEMPRKVASGEREAPGIKGFLRLVAETAREGVCRAARCEGTAASAMSAGGKRSARRCRPATRCTAVTPLRTLPNEVDWESDRLVTGEAFGVTASAVLGTRSVIARAWETPEGVTPNLAALGVGVVTGVAPFRSRRRSGAGPRDGARPPRASTPPPPARSPRK